MNAQAIRAVPGQIFTPETVVGVVFLGVVSLLIVPVPGQALDVLLAVSIGIAAIVFLTALFSERPTDFSVFPTLLLISTLLRLSLNIASTRLILLDGHEGEPRRGRRPRIPKDQGGHRPRREQGRRDRPEQRAAEQAPLPEQRGRHRERWSDQTARL